MEKRVIILFMILLGVNLILGFNDNVNYFEGDFPGDRHAVNPPVHQYLSYQGFLRLEGVDEIYEEFSEYIGSERECVDNYCGDFSEGFSVTEGSFEEDRLGRYLNHFWNPDEGNDVGLCLAIPGFCYDSAYERGIEMWNKAIYSYVYENNKTKAYYYLGRAVHLLEDMSVPAHVHLDAHWGPYGDDSYEEYISYSYDMFDLGNDIFISDNLSDIFYNMAEISDDFDSDDVCGEVDNCSRQYGCDYFGHCDIGLWDCNQIGRILIPAVVEHVTGFYRLFWLETHSNYVSCSSGNCCDENLKIAKKDCLMNNCRKDSDCPSGGYMEIIECYNGNVVLKKGWEDYHCFRRQCFNLGDFEREIIQECEFNCENGKCVDWEIDLKIEGPLEEVYDNRVLIELGIDKKVDSIEMIDNGVRKLLCRNCESYKRFRRFVEGGHRVVFQVLNNGKVLAGESVEFFVDTRKPFVYKTWAEDSGRFGIYLIEENIKDIFLNYDSSKVEVENCFDMRRLTKCEVEVDLSDYSKEFEYWFEIEDVAGNKVEGRRKTLKL